MRRDPAHRGDERRGHSMQALTGLKLKLALPTGDRVDYDTFSL